MSDSRAFVFGYEPAAPMIRAERFGFTARPNLYTAIADHYQLQAVRRDFAERCSQIVGRSLQPIEIHIDAHQFFPGIGSLFDNRLVVNFANIARFISYSSQRLRPLTQTIDNSLGKFFSPYFLPART